MCNKHTKVPQVKKKKKEQLCLIRIYMRKITNDGDSDDKN